MKQGVPFELVHGGLDVHQDDAVDERHADAVQRPDVGVVRQRQHQIGHIRQQLCVHLQLAAPFPQPVVGQVPHVQPHLGEGVAHVDRHHDALGTQHTPPRTG